ISSLDPDMQSSVSLLGFEKIYHNYGGYYNNSKDEIKALLYSNERYKWDSAHEMGHKVMDKYGSESWTHKGTSTRGQSTIPNTPMPSSGEIDIMKYADSYAPDRYKRLVAADEDVQALIWLSRVSFND
ncbi:TPA: PAAR domain-containing protein, partial [Escherichia coli]|nr:PAAR domain-containing protein [Escherichia coli]